MGTLGTAGAARSGEQRLGMVWCPDWPVVAARHMRGADPEQPLIVVESTRRGMRVRAACFAARRAGVRRGMRRREAEAFAPMATVLEGSFEEEARSFERVVRALEAFTPRLEYEEPGWVGFLARGPARYFGGEPALAQQMIAAVQAAGIPEARVGIAATRFVARLAARSTTHRTEPYRIVSSEETVTFLDRWPVDALEDVALSSVLTRLGITTLGSFAALDLGDVVARFGTAGERAYALATGMTVGQPKHSAAPSELEIRYEFEPAVQEMDPVVFMVKQLADALLARLAERGLESTALVVSIESEHGERTERCWRRDLPWRSAEIATRAHWQLEGWDHATAGVSLVRLAAEEVVDARGRQLMVWGDERSREQVNRAASRLVGWLGPSAVVQAQLVGGRTPQEQVAWVPYGERGGAEAPASRALAAPWPGALRGPAPTRVFAEPIAAELLGEDGVPVHVGGRGEARGVPKILRAAVLANGGAEVLGWAGPWAQELRWWDLATRARQVWWQVRVSEGVYLVRQRRGNAELIGTWD